MLDLFYDNSKRSNYERELYNYADTWLLDKGHHYMYSECFALRTMSIEFELHFISYIPYVKVKEVISIKLIEIEHGKLNNLCNV